MSGPVIDVRDLHRTFHADRAELAVRAVDGMTFQIERGESVSIVGPSGCGKSTLLQILGCLDRPTAGSYRLEGSEISDLSERQLAAMRNRHVGFVFQSFQLLPRLTALENVVLPMLYGPYHPDREARAMAALERVGLAARSHHHPAEMSGGQRQRVAIARAIVTQPSLLLCDEPTGALDTRTSDEVLELIEEIHAAGATVVMVTHDMSVARRLQRTLWLSDGRIAQDGPSHEVLEAFLRRLAETDAAQEETRA